MEKRMLVLKLVPVLFIPFFLFIGCSKPDAGALANEKTEESRVPVSIMEVTPTPIRDIIILPGETEAWQDVRVASDIGGRVEWIGPREGETVTKGDPIAKIDTSVRKAGLDSVKAAYALANDLYQRREKLFKRQIITKEELDRSRTERKRAYADLQMAEINYSHGVVSAPITGIINTLFVDAGEFIDTGKPVADIVNIDKIKINVQVPELDVRFLKISLSTPVKIDAFPEKDLIGTIDFIAYKADPATKTFLTRSVIQNFNHEVRPGMIARVVFVRRIVNDALVAPLFALVDKGGERLLFIEKDGVVHARTISMGIIAADKVQITNGLEPGDRLIIKGQTEVEEGMKVIVK